MYRPLSALVVLFASAVAAPAAGLLIPEEKSLPPLAMVSHRVAITLEDQVAVTRVEQVFRNHTDRALEATYIFPVPKGASVNKFTMLVDGKETKGELLEAKKARDIYTSIVRRTQDPGLLEYLGNNLFQMKVFPVPPKADQKVTLAYTSVAERAGDLVEYVYPLKTDGKATATLETFAVEATIASQHAVQNVYSPTHALALKRTNDKKVVVQFEKAQGLLDKDFQLFYQIGDKDVGLTVLTHRPIGSEPGYFLALVTPKVEIRKEYQVPRDMVFVLDTSGSMRGPKMEQARKAMRYCVENLAANDRFALLNFATTVNRYRESLVDASADQLAQAKKWIDALEPTGGTAINDALAAALDYRPKDESRTFTIVFFTDGQPTIGETNVDKILANAKARTSQNTRVFTFGVGDDVNAAMLDRLAEETRAVSTYVRPAEDIEAKVSGLYSKISHPVLTNLKLASTGDIAFSEVYPPQLPDLFHGQQLVVLGRFTGKGPTALKLAGAVGKEAKEFVYELTYPEKTGDERGFVEEIWARRKVGYLLDQIRGNGEKKELVDEVTALAKRYGITTPYTSWLIVPDGPMPVAATPVDGFRSMGRAGGVPGGRPTAPPALLPPGSGGFGGGGLGGGAGPAGAAKPVREFLLKDGAKGEDGLAEKRSAVEGDRLRKATDDAERGGKSDDKATRDTVDKLKTFERARQAFGARAQSEVQSGKLGVDLAVQMQNLRGQSRLDNAAVRVVNGRRCLEIGGVWVDDGFDAKMSTVVVKALSEAYFKILEAQPKMKEVFRLGNHLAWVTPSGTLLVVDTSEGKETLSGDEIAKLFVAKK